MATLIIFSFIVLVISIVVHEFAHGITALWQGDPTAKLAGRLTLNPIKHIDPLGSIVVPIICAILPGGLMIGWAKPVPINPYNFRNKRFGEAIVAFAGPASNFIIAISIGVLLRFAGAGMAPHLVELLALSALINIVLGVFNLVPLPPFDGSKILFSLFPNRMGAFVRAIESYGIILTLVFIFMFLQVLNPIVFFLYGLIVGA